jgi:hypothetical protein
MFESYRAHHRINNLQLEFSSGGVEVGGRTGGSLSFMRLQPIDSLVITNETNESWYRLIFWSPRRRSGAPRT